MFSKKDHYQLRFYEKASRGNLPYSLFKVYIDFFANVSLESLFASVGLNFFSFEKARLKAKKEPKIIKLEFRSQVYAVPVVAFEHLDKEPVFIWLDGYYARVGRAKMETLASTGVKSFEDFLQKDFPLDLEKITIYEARKVNNDNYFPPPIMTPLKLRMSF